MKCDNQNVAPDRSIEHRDVISYLNKKMNEASPIHRLNEKILVQLLNFLDEDALLEDELYWLSLARIHELAIVCAGNYARNCEFALAGDLLVNPRLVLIHLKGRRQPIVKRRHTPLTEQFSHMASSRERVIAWLTKHTIVETRKKALLPHLLHRITDSGMFTEAYVNSVEALQNHVADTLVTMSTEHLKKHASVVAWPATEGLFERNCVMSSFYPFDLERFASLGEEIEKTLADAQFESRVLIRVKGAVENKSPVKE